MPPRRSQRAGETIREALADSEVCPLHLENTAGAGGTLGRSIDELAALLDAAGDDERLGLCLDSCHLFASGYDIRTYAGMDELTKEIAREDRPWSAWARCTSTTPRPRSGSNRDRHANVGPGELGESGCAAFLSAPPFQDLPCVLETPGENRSGPTREEIQLAVKLRERGVRERESRLLNRRYHWLPDGRAPSRPRTRRAWRAKDAASVAC